jgi:rubrerythrin
MVGVPAISGQRGWKSLQASFTREEQGRNWYRKSATETPNPVAKLTFEMLAHRQERFLQVIQSVILTFQGKSDRSRQEARLPGLQPVEAVVERVLHDASRSSHQETSVAHEDTFRAYLWALGFEEEGVEMYAELAEHAEHKSLAELFAFLQKREGEHYRILDQTLACAHLPETSSDRIADSLVGQQGG